MIDWYTFNVLTLTIDIVVTFFAFSTLFVVVEEQKKLRRMKDDCAKRERWGVRK